MNSGDIVGNRFESSDIYLLLYKFKFVDEPACMCLELKTCNKIWFYEHDLKLRFKLEKNDFIS